MARKLQRAANAKKERKAPTLEPDLWEPPPLSECEEREFVTEPDSTNRIVARRVTWNGQLVSYAIIHVTLERGDEWTEVACVDCCHSYVHLHSGPDHAESREDIQPIHTQQDVQSSFSSSFDLIYDSYITFKGQQ